MLRTTYRKTSELIPYANNARTHSDGQLAKLAASIKEFGFNQPILVNSENVIIAGHARLEAARKAGLDEVPTITIDHLSKTAQKAYILADNRINLDSGWDDGLLKLEFDALHDEGFDLDLTGFDDDEICDVYGKENSEGQTDPDSVPEISGDPVTRTGDIWLLGNHRLMCGDSTMIDQVERLMNGEKAAMVYADPPYGINLETDYKKRYGNEKGSTSSQFYGEDKGIDLSAIINNSFCVGAKDLFIWGADNYPDCLPRGGSWVVWDKSVEAVDGIASDFELCWSRERHHYSMIRKLWKGAKAREETGQEGAHRTRWGHPTQKPIELALFFFDHWGKKAKVILDYFGGSGTTLIACEKTGRKCLMMEISPQYCDVIIRRWQEFTGKQAILESGVGTFEEMANGESRQAIA